MVAGLVADPATTAMPLRLVAPVMFAADGPPLPVVPPPLRLPPFAFAAGMFATLVDLPAARRLAALVPFQVATVMRLPLPLMCMAAVPFP